MLDFTIINCDDIYVHYSFDSIEELRKEYYKDEFPGIPMLDDPVVDMEFNGIPMYADTFNDIVKLFGIDNSPD